MPKRIIAIGDIHGCNVALSALLDELRPNQDDTIVQLGDQIDRGPNSRLVIEQLIALSSSCQLISLLGDHEELFLRALEHPEELPRWLRNGGTETLQSYGWHSDTRLGSINSVVPRQHISFIQSARDFYEIENFIFVHAGYVPESPMHAQPGLALRWMVSNRDTCKPHCSGKTVIVGHTAQRDGEILDLGFLKCIDTNCVRGGYLTALDTISGTVWQVDRHGKLRLNS